MLHRRFVRREIASSPKQSAVFVLCVALSMVSLVSLGGFARSVDLSLARDARELHAADIIINSHYDFSPPLLAAMAPLERERRVSAARLYDFYTMVRPIAGSGSLLASLRVAGRGYPFYGEAILASGRPLGQVLRRGRAVAEQALLDRLGLKPGDAVRVGGTTLVVDDVLLREPDRPVNFFSLGPRLLASGDDLEALGLVGKGSRVEQTLLLRVRDEGEIDRLAALLRGAAIPRQERVETFRTASSGVKRFFDNFLFFLNLIGIFTLLLAGIGIQSSLAALLREREKTIAVLKALGATSGFIARQYFLMASLLGLAGTMLGLGAGYLVQRFLPVLFRGLLPSGTGTSLSMGAVLEGFLLGAVTVGIFTFLPLHRLREVKPNAILGREAIRPRRLPALAAALAVVLFFAAVVLWRIRDQRTGLWFIAGVLGLVAVAAGATELLLRLLRKTPLHGLAVRQALRGLYRPGNATRPILVTLAASLSLIFAIWLIEQNLDENFVRSYPPDAPNVYFLDIQPDQRHSFARALGVRADFYPIVRARISAVNGAVVNREREMRSRQDNLGREMNLTWRDHLLDDEELQRGSGLFRPDWKGAQVSVLDEVLKMRRMAIGDRITFDVQGVPLEARVSSIRTRKKAAVRPFFYFVLPEEALREAPQTFFASARVDRRAVPALQTRMVDAFPNVSVLDIGETVTAFARVMNKLSGIVRFFTSFSIAAGLLIIVSSILATRHARIQEAVYFKIIGARGRFVLAVFTLENLFLGLASAAMALLLSQAGSWAVAARVFDIPYDPHPAAGLVMTAGTAALVVAVGLLASRSILRHRPASFLREENLE